MINFRSKEPEALVFATTRTTVPAGLIGMSGPGVRLRSIRRALIEHLAQPAIQVVPASPPHALPNEPWLRAK
jgi:hypothetical protein